jgi:hypothetical protein
MLLPSLQLLLSHIKLVLLCTLIWLRLVDDACSYLFFDVSSYLELLQQEVTLSDIATKGCALSDENYLNFQ